jgi:release factor H-coupled RctB family protein
MPQDLPTDWPAHARVIGLDDVWMEGDALRQLAGIAREPGCVRAVGLPDLHPGPGVPIGAAFAFTRGMRPDLVGGDAGCGARVVGVPRVRHRGDDLERRVWEATEGPAIPDADPAALLAATWSGGARGLGAVPGVPDSLVALAESEPALAPLSATPPDDPELGAALGTIGGGNHFLEASRVGAVVDREAAAAVGLRPGGFAVLAHSGSRGLGAWLKRRWSGQVLDGDAWRIYRQELEGAVRFAQANRLVLCWRMLGALGVARPGAIAGGFDVVHNTADPLVVDGQDAWVFRKGSAPAGLGQATVVLGSRGAPSHVLRGLGEPGCLCSVAHGAGRRYGRNDAVSRFKHRYTRASMQRTAVGSRVLYDDNDLLYAEHPDAYKDVASVVAALVAAGAAARVAELTPMVTVKR